MSELYEPKKMWRLFIELKHMYAEVENSSSRLEAQLKRVFAELERIVPPEDREASDEQWKEWGETRHDSTG